MKLTIFNTQVKVTSQEQAYKLKNICVNNNLLVWDEHIAFKCIGNDNDFFRYTITNEFFIAEFSTSFTEVTEQEWLKLLEEYKSNATEAILNETDDFFTNIKNLVESTPNDQELGSKIRKIILDNGNK